MNKIIFFTITGSIAIIILANLFLSPPHFSSIAEKAKFQAESGNSLEAEKSYEAAIKQHPYDIDLYHDYIDVHFRNVWDFNSEAHLTFINYFNNLIKEKDPAKSDLGMYGKSLIYSYQNRIDQALVYLNKVRNHHLKYYNNSMGFCLLKKGKEEEAEKYFLKEIALNGNVRAAYENLADLYQKRNNNEKLLKLLENPEAASHISFNLKREFYFYKGDFLNYFIVIFQAVKSKTNWYGFTAAFFILITWILYLRKLDIYELEKWTSVIVTLVLGIVFAQGTFFLNDFNELILGNKLTGKFLDDFFYCFLGIGAVEELVKIIPVLLVLGLTKEIDEPIDYIKYASISAAGFAFTENLLYFNNDSLHIIPSRALICVTSHMFYSSIVAYGLMLSKYRNHKYKWATVILAFLIASFFHGFYDFWLINQSLKEFSYLSFLFFFLTTFIWMMLVNNCLSNSPFYSEEKEIDILKLRDYLFASLIGVFVIQFLLISFRLGPQEGNLTLMQETTFGLIVLPLVVKTMSNVRILNNYWSHHLFPKYKIHYEHLLDQNIDVIIDGQNKNISSFHPILQGRMIRREVISNNPNWFLAQLEEPIIFNESYYYKVFISPRKLTSRKANYRFQAYILLPDASEISTDSKDVKNFKFGGLAEISIITS